MSVNKDQTYYSERARREREIARTCEDKGIARVHLRMADEYDKLISGRPRALQAARDI